MRSVLTTAAIAAAVSAQPAAAQLDLAFTGTFTLPAATFDLQPDGTILAIAADGTVLTQDQINGSTYSPTGATIGPPNSSGFGASFVSVSPDGQSVAVGNGEFSASNAVSIFAAADLNTPGTAAATTTITTPNFAADWADNTTLFVTGATSDTFTTVVNQLDITASTSTTVVTPAGGFSGGVAANNGTLFVGAGDTGEVRSFDASFPIAPVDFITGAAVATANSAGSIDALGHLVLIAGQQFGGIGSAFVIDQSTGLTATLQPAGPDAFYGGYFNPITNELVVTANGTGFVYAIPAPATLALAPLGLVALRRRRA
ncbi:MAG: hypothetical protein AAF937_06410 [Planctomycetota bacterium]